MITLKKEDTLATGIRYVNSKKLKNKYGIYCIWIKTTSIEAFTEFWTKRSELYATAKAVSEKATPKLPELTGAKAFEKDGYTLVYMGKTTSLDADIKAQLSIAETTEALKLFGSNMKSKKLTAEAKQIMMKDNKTAPFDGIMITYSNCWKELGHIKALLDSEYKKLIGTTDAIVDETIECDLTQIKKDLKLV